jgi:uncharacterized membrane protein HdeD (DUF308 family)
MTAELERRPSMSNVLSRYWWILALRGAIAVIFGLLAFIWPEITLATLILFFSAYVLMDGAFSIIHAIGGWQDRDDRWFLLLEGLLGVGIGISTYHAPGIVATGILLYIAAWSLGMGILKIVSAIRLRKAIQGEWWLAGSGIASLLFAALLMWFPAVGALGLLWLIAGYAFIFGLVSMAVGFKVRGLGGEKEGAKA